MSIANAVFAMGCWHTFTSPEVRDFEPYKGEDTNAKRKARKERARTLTKQREAELKALGKWKGK